MTSLATKVGHVVLPNPRVRWTVGLVVALSLKDFRTRFRRSFFGIAWLLVQPVMQALVLFFVAAHVFRVRGVDNYPLFILSGVMPWAFTSQGLSAATMSVVANAPLVKKVRVPPITFPMAAAGGSLLVFFAPLSLLVVVSVIAGGISWWVLLLPLVLLLHYALVVSVGTLTAGFYVYYRDIRNFVEAVMGLLLYATPVMYPLSLLPGWAEPIVRANPMTGILGTYRAMFTGRGIDFGALCVSVGFVAVVLPLGTYIFTRRSGEFADLV
jgi:lipopolysaccharide transport system permease protein